jgi:hypothetical protein
VISAVPICLAVLAGMGSEKNIQTWPPFPNLDRSKAAAIPLQVGSQLASERAFDRNVRRSRNSKKRLDDTYQYIYLPLRNKGKRSCTSEWPSFFRTLLNC